MMYDPANDRSEEAGWKKVCDETPSTEEEQHLWNKIGCAVTAKCVTMVFSLEILF